MLLEAREGPDTVNALQVAPAPIQSDGFHITGITDDLLQPYARVVPPDEITEEPRLHFNRAYSSCQ
jgi:hypothetical protein